MKERRIKLKRLCAAMLSAAMVLGGTEASMFLASAAEFNDAELFSGETDDAVAEGEMFSEEEACEEFEEYVEFEEYEEFADEEPEILTNQEEESLALEEEELFTASPEEELFSSGSFEDEELFVQAGDVGTDGYAEGKDASKGVDLTHITVPTRFAAGEGYLLFTPANGETPNTLVLHNAAVNNQTGSGGSYGDACVKLPPDTVVLLEGENVLTSGNRGLYTFYKDDEGHNRTGTLTVKGSGSLTTYGNTGLSAPAISIEGTTLNIYGSGVVSGINSSAGDVTIADSKVTVKIEGSGNSSGAVLANDNQGINGSNSNIYIRDSNVVVTASNGPALCAAYGSVYLEDSRVIAIGNSEFGAIDFGGSDGKVSVSGGILYAENPNSNGYDISYTKRNTSSDSAVIYYHGEINYLVANGSVLQIAGASYDEASDTIMMPETADKAAYIYGDFVWPSGDLPINAKAISVQGSGSLTIPEGMEVSLPMYISLSKDGQLINSGTLNLDSYINSKGTITNTGTLTSEAVVVSFGTMNNTGTINSVIKTAEVKEGETVYVHTASGEAVYHSAYVTAGTDSDGDKNVLIIPQGFRLTIPAGEVLDLTKNGITHRNLGDYFTCAENGLAVEGTVIFPKGTSEKMVANLGITGNGTVEIEKGPFVISAHPESVQLENTYTEAPVLSVTAEKTDIAQGELRYQWHQILVNEDGTETDTAISGAEESTYTLPLGMNAGNYEYYCVITCDGFDADSERALVSIHDGHLWGDWTEKDGTEHQRTCAICKDTETEKHIGEANCHAKAICTVCGVSFGEIDADHHTGGTETRNAKTATHTRTGYTGDLYCKGCGKRLQSGKTISMVPYTAADISANSKVLNVNAKLGWSGKNMKIGWSKVSEAQGYDVFAAKCGKSMKLVKTVKSSTASALIARASGAKVKTTGNYKAQVRAYRMINGKKKYIANSLILHTVGKSNKKYTNATKVKASKSAYTLRKGKTASLSVKVTKQSGKKKLLTKSHGARLRYWSSNTKVASVSGSGKIKAVGKGSCYVYIVAQNGVKTRTKVTVR